MKPVQSRSVPIRKILLSLCILLTGFTLPTARGGAVSRKDAHRIRAESAPRYRVVELGRHRFLDQPFIPREVAALLARRGVGGFSDADTNTQGDRISNDDGPSSRAYVSHGGRVRALQPLPNLSRSAAIGINNRGGVVGASWDDDQTYRAVLWRHGRVYDLSAHCLGKWAHLSGPSLFGRGLAINDRGQIIADYIGDGRSADYYLLTPVSSVSKPTDRRLRRNHHKPLT